MFSMEFQEKIILNMSLNFRNQVSTTTGMLVNNNNFRSDEDIERFNKISENEEVSYENFLVNIENLSKS